MPLALNQKIWNDPKKTLARQETIINQYHKLFGLSVPPSRQYWSMCGQCSTSNGEFQEGCELDQILKAKLIVPKQFHGVDINPEISKSNKEAFPEANWYADDFYKAMLKAKSENKFNPAIVNADFINMPDRACGYFADILAMLSVFAASVMVVGNMVLKYQRFEDRDRDMEFTINKLNEQPQFQFALKKANWEFDQKYYRYGGTGDESRTTMGTIIFYKEK